MKTGCEISHTILDSTVARSEYEDVLQEDVYGETIRIGAGKLQRVLPCLNDDDVRNYLLGLFHDLSSNYDLDYIQSCLILFKGNSLDYENPE